MISEAWQASVDSTLVVIRSAASKPLPALHSAVLLLVADASATPPSCAAPLSLLTDC